jgi:hypothetical protein
MDKLSIKIAKEKKDLEAARNLVLDRYKSRSYIDDLEGDLFSPRFKDSEIVFTVEKDNKIAGTIAVINDSKEEGLPMDKIYKQELDELRLKGKKLAEISRFASDEENLKKVDKLRVLTMLFKLAFHYGIKNKIDCLCITTTLEHGASYKFFHFKDIGEPKYYDSVRVQAIGKILDINEVQNMNTLNPLLAEIRNNPPDIFEKIS